MITVIIPVLNEEDTIASVVDYAFTSPLVSEVIVVDDKSADNTASIAAAHGATVITSGTLGKGASMYDGVQHATNEMLVFLDGDINPYPPKTIDLLTTPLLQGEAEFVKSTFSRNAGRVTELVAKPLLSILFPNLASFSQPLSGIISGKKSLFNKVTFREDYGVDIGLLIDMYLMNARICEVEIGYIGNKSKPWQALGKMSKEVAQAIIMKAVSTNNPRFNLEELGVISEIRSQMDFVLDEQLQKLEKLIIFDMDNTLLNGRFIDTCANHFGFKNELWDLRTSESDPVLLTKRIAMLLKGKAQAKLLELADSIPLVPDAAEVVGKLKKRGYLTGIISDSYLFVANHLKQKAGIDFALANELEFSKGVCTGEVRIPSFFFNNLKSICKHPICKTNAVLTLLEKHKLSIENAIAIGDSHNDLCMITQVGLGIAFRSNDELLNHYADITVDDNSFAVLIDEAR